MAIKPKPTRRKKHPIRRFFKSFQTREAAIQYGLLYGFLVASLASGGMYVTSNPEAYACLFRGISISLELAVAFVVLGTIMLPRPFAIFLRFGKTFDIFITVFLSTFVIMDILIIPRLLEYSGRLPLC